MNIFHKRPLCLILCIMLGGFVVFTVSDIRLRVPLLVSVGALLLFALIIAIKKRRSLPLISACALSLSIFFSFIYFENFFYADKKYHGESEIVATVSDIDAGEYVSSVYLQTETINGDRASYKIHLRASSDELEGAWEGDTVRFHAVLTRAESAILYGDGVGSVATPTSDITVVTRSDSPPLSARLRQMRDNLSRHLIMLTDSHAGGLLTALITGERDYLSDTVRLDFQRSGLTHMLALSGMHLAIIALGLSKLLRLARLPRKLRLIATLVFAFAYTAFTGCPITVLRAAIMLTVTTLMRLFSRAHDSLTSLSIAVFLIVLSSPYAIFDISLWLSALATLGIISGAEYESENNIRTSGPKLKVKLFTALRYTALAISATILISILTFGTVSIASPISTLIVSFLVEILMYLGFAMILIFNIIPISELIKPLSRLITDIIAKISDIEWVLFRADRPAVMVLTLILTALFVVFLIFKIEKRRLFLGAILCVFTSIFILGAALSAIDLNKDTVIVSATDKRDVILASSEGESLLVSSSSYSASSAYTAISLLEESNRLHLDKYCATHYSKNLEKELSVLLSYIHVDEVYVPNPRNGSEEDILKKLKLMLSDTRTVLKYYSTDTPIAFGDASLHLLYSLEYGEGSSTNAYSLMYGGALYTYLSSGTLESQSSGFISAVAAKSDVLIFGSHGKSYTKTIMYNERNSKHEKLIISSEELYSTQECKEYYENNGCDIISHPLNKDILIRH